MIVVRRSEGSLALSRIAPEGISRFSQRRSYALYSCPAHSCVPPIGGVRQPGNDGEECTDLDAASRTNR